MDRNFEVRVNITGEEWSVRPVSAMEYLNCVREAQALIKKLDAEGEAELIRRACVLARGIYSDGERVFKDGESVLEVLTPEEIYSISAGTLRAEGEPGRGEDKAHGRAAEAREDTEVMSESSLTTWFKTETGYTNVVDVKKDVRTAETTAQQPVPAKKPEYTVPVRRAENSLGETSYRRKVRDMSDFLMRDSRRYDGGFELY